MTKKISPTRSMGTLLGIMNSKAAALNTFLKSLKEREINVEDVARIKKLSDVLEVKYANIESTWESLVKPGEDPFKDDEEYDNAKEIMKRHQLPLTSIWRLPRMLSTEHVTKALPHKKVLLIVQVVVGLSRLTTS